MMNGNFNQLLFAAVLSCCLFACSPDKATETNTSSILPEFARTEEKVGVDAYMNWVENERNGLKVQKKIGDMTFSALYKPYEYLAIMELKRNGLTAENLQKKIKEYDGMQYVTYKIAAENQQQELLKVGISNDKEYYARLEYISFEMQKDFKLIDGKDTLDCLLYHFERVYGLAPYATVVLGFPATKDKQSAEKRFKNDKTIGYTDKLFGTGNVYMTIKEEDLNRLPELSSL
jgi:hypothetical protein